MNTLSHSHLSMSWMWQFTSILLLASFSAWATPNPDGTINAGEYTYSSGAYNVDFDETKLYFGVTGLNSASGADGVQIYLDFDLNMPVNSGNGTMNGKNWDDVTPTLPFNADYFIFFENPGQVELHSWNGSAWVHNSMATISVASNNNASPNGHLEMSISWSDLGQTGKADFNWLAYKSFWCGPNGGLFDAEPNTGNPANSGGCAARTDRFYYYHSAGVGNSGGRAAGVFDKISFTQSNGGRYAYATASLYSSLYDMTAYNGTATYNSANQDGSGKPYGAWSSGGNRIEVNQNVEIRNNLVIGIGSAFGPDLSTTPTVTMTGADGESQIYNQGRLDSNWEISACVPTTTTRLNFSFTGNVTLLPSTLGKDFYRFSNVHIGSGGKWQSSTTGQTDIEFQFGELTNDGILDFERNPGTGFVDVGSRGDLPLAGCNQNNYGLKGSAIVGNTKFHKFLIGRESSKIYAAGNLTIDIKENFENYDEFEASNGSGALTVRMNSSIKAQELIGQKGETTNQNTTFANLVIDNTFGDVSFESNTMTLGDYIFYDITGTLTLTAGRLMTRTNAGDHNNFDHHILTIKPGAAASSTSSSSFVHGPVFKEGTTDFTFPIGKGTYRAMAGVSDLVDDCSGAASFKAEYFATEGPNGGTLDAASTNLLAMSDVEYWDISRNTSVCVSTDAKVTLHFDDNARSLVNEMATLKVVHFDGTNWDDQNASLDGASTSNANASATSGNPSSGWVMSENVVTTFSPFSFGSATATQLPVELLHFTARARGGKAYLDWATASEENSSHFEVQRSLDGRDFEAIAEQRAAGNSATEQHYHFIDRGVAAQAYYRLRIVDLDGTFEYSEIRHVSFDGELSQGVVIFPNPNKGEFSFQLQQEADILGLRIYNATGQLVRDLGRPASRDIQAAGLSPGLYYLELHTAQGAVTNRFTVR